MTPAVAQTRTMPVELPPEPVKLEEDSTLYKVLTCIPILGVIPFKIQDYSLTQKVKTFAERPDRIIEVLKVSKDYQVMNIIRTVLSIALIVTGLAMGIILKGLAIVSLAILSVRIVCCINTINGCNELIAEIKNQKGV